MLQDCRRPPRSFLDFAVDVGPSQKSTRHRRYVLVSHLLHRQRRERGAVSTRAVDDDSLRAIDHSLDLRLEIAAREMNGPRKVAEIPFVGLAHVEVDSA